VHHRHSDEQSGRQWRSTVAQGVLLLPLAPQLARGALCPDALLCANLRTKLREEVAETAIAMHLLGTRRLSAEVVDFERERDSEHAPQRGPAVSAVA
jgi:hypothetical protein